MLDLVDLVVALYGAEFLRFVQWPFSKFRFYPVFSSLGNIAQLALTILVSSVQIRHLRW